MPSPTEPQSEIVGVLTGSGDVSLSGAFTYDVPLDVPAGVAGMSPSLSLHYTQHQGNGALGRGFTISGADSAIGRCEKTIATEGVASGVHFGEDDAFCLDGVKLVEVPNKSPAEYRTEEDEFSRIVFENGIFTVYKKSGQILTYEAQSVPRTNENGVTSNVLPKWRRTRAADRAGNEILYTYKDHGTPGISSEILIDRIEFTKTSTAAARRSVRFVYEPKTGNDISTYFENGMAFPSTQRLIRIEMYAPNPTTVENVWSYTLTYGDVNGHLGHSLLVSVEKQGALGSKLLAKNFAWQTPNPVFDAQPAPLPLFDATPLEMGIGRHTYHVVLDVDGDGFDDLLYETWTGKSEGIWSSYQHTLYLGGVNGFSDPIDLPNLNLVSLSHSRAVDFTGAGAAGILAFRWAPSSDPASVCNLVGVNDTHFNPNCAEMVSLVWDAALQDFKKIGSTNMLQIFPNEPEMPSPFVMADVNGDGLADIVSATATTGTAYDGQIWGVQLSLGNGYFGKRINAATPVTSGWPSSYPNYCAQTLISDFDGDGRADVAVGSAQDCTQGLVLSLDEQNDVIFRPGFPLKVKIGTATPQATLSARLADLNGDGLKDVVYVGEMLPLPMLNASRVSWNYGNFQWAQFPLDDDDLDVFVVPPYTDIAEGDVPLTVVDVDQDGRDDLVLTVMNYNAPGYSLVSLISQGNGQFEVDWMGVQLPAPPSWDPKEVKTVPTIEPCELDRDGRSDLLVDYFDGYTSILSRQSTDGFAVSSIWDGDDVSNPRALVRYTRTQPADSAAATCTFPQRCVRTARPVVESVSGLDFADGAGYYHFEDPRVDAQGRGFLGFGVMRQWYPLRSHERTTFFDHATSLLHAVPGPGTGRIYPNARRPAKVVDATAILTHDAAWASGAQPNAAIARQSQSIRTYETLAADGGVSYFVHGDGQSEEMWESPVSIDWTPNARVHIKTGAAPSDGGPAALRRQEASSTVDAFGNTLTTALGTMGGVRAEAVYTYYPPSLGDWKIGLVKTEQKRSYTEGAPLPPFTYTEFTYEARGLLWQTLVEPNGTPDVNETITRTYDAQGRLTSSTATAAGELPRFVGYQYADVSGEGIYASATWNGVGVGSFSWTHPALGTPWGLMDANGATTLLVHDDLGRETQVSYPGGGSKEITYAPYFAGGGTTVGTIVTTTNANGAKEMVTIDQRGRVLVRTYSTFSGSASQVYSYDDLSRRTAVSNPDQPSDVTTTVYDSLDRVHSITAPDGSSMKFTHTFLETEAIDPENRVSWEHRDLDGRKISVTQSRSSASSDPACPAGLPGTITTTYSYGPNDQIETITDPMNNVISIAYDVRGRVVAKTTPDDGTRILTLNGYGELSQSDTPTGAVHYYRDAAGRVFSEHSPDGVTLHTYDNKPNGMGLVGTELSPDGTQMDYEYDSIGRLVSTTYRVDGEDYVVSTGYDGIGRVSTIGYPSVPGMPAFQVTPRYDNPSGFVTEVDATGDGGVLAPVWKVLDRTASGALALSKWANGVSEERTYDPKSLRLLSVSSVGLQDKTYSYYADGRVRAVSDEQDGRKQSYCYDGLGRLSSWYLSTGKGETVSTYRYDDLGNLVDVFAGPNKVEHNQYGGPAGGPHALTEHNGVSYGYDARGRLESSTDGLGVQYTNFDLPRTFERNGATTTFLYSPGGQRVMKSGPDGTTVSIGGLYERRVKAGSNDADLHVFMVQGSVGAIAQFEYDAGAAKGKYRYLHPDPLGSVGLVTDELGNAERHYNDPFGGRSDADGNPIGALQSSVRGGFAGHDYDDDLGVINMKGRLYDPRLKRFFSPDPVVVNPSDSQAYNRYSYVRNDPVNAVDPTGYQEWQGSWGWLQYSMPVGVVPQQRAAISPGDSGIGVRDPRGGSAAASGIARGA